MKPLGVDQTPRGSARAYLVTGASRGIGRGIAVDLAAAGHRLTVTSRRQSDLESLADLLVSEGAQEVLPVAVNLADSDAGMRLIRAHMEAHAQLDGLIINAGSGTAGDVGHYPQSRLEKTFRVNVNSTFSLIQSGLPALTEAAQRDPSRGARIVVMSSITGVYAEAGLAAYGASKAALISLVEAINAEVSMSGVSATAIAPGYVDTDMSAWITDQIPASTMIPVSDVVEVVRMLLSLSPRTVVSRMVLSRSGTSGFTA